MLTGYVGNLSFVAIYILTLFVLAALALVFSFRNSRTAKPLLLFKLLSLVMLVESAFTVTSFGEWQLLVLLPFLQGIMATSLSVLEMLKDRELSHARGRLLAVVLIALLLVGGSLRIDASQYIQLERTGGTGYYSDATYALAIYLIAHPEFKPIAVDWGFADNIYIDRREDLTQRDFRVS
jgi:hypothetical protein